MYAQTIWKCWEVQQTVWTVKMPLDTLEIL